MTRFSKKIILLRIVGGLITALFFILMFNFSLFEGEENENIIDNIGIVILIDIIVFILAGIVITIYSYLYYKSAGYSINNEEIKCQRGVIFKKTSIIKREKINAINTKQSLLARIFHVKYILVDSGSTNTAFNAEFAVVLDNEDADKLYKQIKIMKDTKDDITNDDEALISNYENVISGQDYDYHFTSKGKFLYSLSNILTFVISFLIFVMIGVIAIVIINSITTFDLFWTIILTIIFGYLGLAAFTTAVSVVTTFFMYHNFNIKKGATSLQISHGLLTKVDNSLEYSKIRGVTIYQNIIMRIFGYATIYLNVVGYGQNSNNQNNSSSQNAGIPGVLIPLCRLDEVNKYLNDLVGGYKVDDKDIASPSITPFLTWSNLSLFISMVVPSIVILLIGIFYSQKAFYGFIAVGMLYLFSEIILIINGILAKKTNGITVNDDKVTVYYGSFTKRILVVEKKNIIGVEDISTPLRRKKGIYSYVIHFHNNSTLNTVRVECVESKVMNQVLDMLDFSQNFIKNNLKK